MGIRENFKEGINRTTQSPAVSGLFTLWIFAMIVFYFGLYKELNEFVRNLAPSFIAGIVVYVMIKAQENADKAKRKKEE